MKKFTVIFVLCFLSLAPAAGQNWSFGAKGGINLPVGNFPELPTFPDNTLEKSKMNGFYLGGFTQYSFSPKFALQAEVLFSRQRFEGKDSRTLIACGPEGSFTFLVYYGITTEIDYLTIPILARHSLFGNLNVEFGPQIGFLLHAENSIEDSDSPENYKPLMNKTDFALVGGLTYTLFGHLDITARYMQGLKNVYKCPISAEHTNQLFQLGVGYRF